MPIRVFSIICDVLIEAPWTFCIMEEKLEKRTRKQEDAEEDAQEEDAKECERT